MFLSSRFQNALRANALPPPPSRSFCNICFLAGTWLGRSAFELDICTRFLLAREIAQLCDAPCVHKVHRALRCLRVCLVLALP